VLLTQFQRYKVVGAIHAFEYTNRKVVGVEDTKHKVQSSLLFFISLFHLHNNVWTLGYLCAIWQKARSQNKLCIFLTYYTLHRRHGALMPILNGLNFPHIQTNVLLGCC